MQETCKIGVRILASSFMSIMHLSYIAVNHRTQFRLQVLDQSLVLLELPQR